jgi:phage portal protein BeeE
MEAKKDMWEDRLKPDVERFAEGITQEILPAYGDNLVLEPDFSGVEALQPDRERLAKTFEVAIRNGMATPNDAAKALGLETSDEPGADQRYIQSGLVPISFGMEDMSVQENDKFYQNIGLPEGM